MSRDFLDDADKSRELVYRHLAWLTALRYQPRESRAWESTSRAHNAEYLRYYSVPEMDTPLEKELARFLPEKELAEILATRSKATQILGHQSEAIKELLSQQGRWERINDFPYPRQFAAINSIFIRLFCLLLPFGLLREFDHLNESVEGAIKGHTVWLVVPFSVLISWIYTSLGRVGESTENPLQGSPNDIPISQLCRTAEIDLREMLGGRALPSPLSPRHDIVL